MNDLVLRFPNLSATPHQITSPAETTYNCIAWAAGDDRRCWWPDVMGIGAWPLSAPREETIKAFVEAFKSIGYSECPDAGFERGFLKVAIYADSAGKPTHAARQLKNGQWTSKCGDLEDIEHTLDAFERSSYGSPVAFLKRSK